MYLDSEARLVGLDLAFENFRIQKLHVSRPVQSDPVLFPPRPNPERHDQGVWAKHRGRQLLHELAHAKRRAVLHEREKRESEHDLHSLRESGGMSDQEWVP